MTKEDLKKIISDQEFHLALLEQEETKAHETLARCAHEKTHHNYIRQAASTLMHRLFTMGEKAP